LSKIDKKPGLERVRVFRARYGFVIESGLTRRDSMRAMHTNRRGGQGAGLWALVLGGGEIDPQELAAGVEAQLLEGDLDFRSRLLVRDALEVLARHWGEEQFGQWRNGSPAGRRVEAIRAENLGEPGFPSLGQRLMNSTKAEVVMQFLRELGLSVSEECSFVIGGAIALILAHRLARHTEDVDVVDEVPAGIRGQHELLTRLAQRYGLHLTHFQSHYRPGG
jgi:hypothetical protein